MRRIIIIIVILLIGIVGYGYYLYIGKSAVNDDEVSDIESNGYTLAELEEMALDYYEFNYGERPPLVSSMRDDNGMVLIQLYSFNIDHNSTWDYYTIDPNTGIGTNVMGEVVDLTSVLK